VGKGSFDCDWEDSSGGNEVVNLATNNWKESLQLFKSAQAKKDKKEQPLIKEVCDG